jgi:hypothetical protein
MNSTQWKGMDGKVYEQRLVFRADSFAQACNYCEAMGAHKERSKMQGTIFSGGYVVQYDPFTAGYLVMKSFQQ